MNSKEEAAEVLRFKIIQIKNRERRLVFDQTALDVILGTARDVLAYLNPFIDQTSYSVILARDLYRWLNNVTHLQNVCTLQSYKLYIEQLIEAFELILEDLLAN